MFLTRSVFTLSLSIYLYAMSDYIFRNILYIDMSQIPISNYVLDDLIRFISTNFQNNLPNSLLIAQAFILHYPDYGREYGLPLINKIIEDGIKEGLLK